MNLFVILSFLIIHSNNYNFLSDISLLKNTPGKSSLAVTTNYLTNAENEHMFEIDGRKRIYLMHIPDGLANEAPLVFVLHGYGGDAKSMMDYSKMNEVADKNGFAVCYPQGYFGNDDKNSWNAGYSNFDVDDVNFISSLASHLLKAYSLSKKYLFCTGMSNGADMSYLMACQKPDLFRAVATVAGCMMQSTYDQCDKLNPVSIFEIHGTDDTITLWNGDKNYLPGSGGYLSVPTTINYWIDKNKNHLITVDTLTNIDPNDGSFVIRTKHSNKRTSHQTWLYTLEGGGHDWPGSWGNMDFNASEEIWNFFKIFIE